MSKIRKKRALHTEGLLSTHRKAMHEPAQMETEHETPHLPSLLLLSGPPRAALSLVVPDIAPKLGAEAADVKLPEPNEETPSPEIVATNLFFSVNL